MNNLLNSLIFGNANTRQAIQFVAYNYMITAFLIVFQWLAIEGIWNGSYFWAVSLFLVLLVLSYNVLNVIGALIAASARGILTGDGNTFEPGQALSTVMRFFNTMLFVSLGLNLITVAVRFATDDIMVLFAILAIGFFAIIGLSYGYLQKAGIKGSFIAILLIGIIAVAGLQTFWPSISYQVFEEYISLQNDTDGTAARISKKDSDILDKRSDDALSTIEMIVDRTGLTSSEVIEKAATYGLSDKAIATYKEHMGNPRSHKSAQKMSTKIANASSEQKFFWGFLLIGIIVLISLFSRRGRSSLLVIVISAVIIIGGWYVITNWDEFDFGNGVVFDQQVRPQKGGTPISFTGKSGVSYRLFIDGIRKQYSSNDASGTGYATILSDGRRLKFNNTKWYDSTPLSPSNPWGAAIIWKGPEKYYLDTNQSLSFAGKTGIRIDSNVPQNDSQYYTKSRGTYRVIIKKM